MDLSGPPSHAGDKTASEIQNIFGALIPTPTSAAPFGLDSLLLGFSVAHHIPPSVTRNGPGERVDKKAVADQAHGFPEGKRLEAQRFACQPSQSRG